MEGQKEGAEKTTNSDILQNATTLQFAPTTNGTKKETTMTAKGPKKKAKVGKLKIKKETVKDLTDADAKDIKGGGETRLL